jgi:hypothetical protein
MEGSPPGCQPLLLCRPLHGGDPPVPHARRGRHGTPGGRRKRLRRRKRGKRRKRTRGELPQQDRSGARPPTSRTPGGRGNGRSTKRRGGDRKQGAMGSLGAGVASGSGASSRAARRPLSILYACLLGETTPCRCYLTVGVPEALAGAGAWRYWKRRRCLVPPGVPARSVSDAPDRPRK